MCIVSLGEADGLGRSRCSDRLTAHLLTLGLAPKVPAVGT